MGFSPFVQGVWFVVLPFLFCAVAEVGDEAEEEDEGDGEDGGVELLGQGDDGEQHGAQQHDELDADDYAVAPALADGEVEEEGRGPQDVEVGLGAVVVGEEPQEDDEHGDEEGEDEEDGIEPAKTPAFVPAKEGDDHDGDEEDPEEEGGGDTAGEGLAGLGEQLLGRGHKGLAGVGDGHGVELGHHLDGGEHVLVVGAAVVAALAKGYVDAEPPPEEVVGGVAVEELAVGKVGVGGGLGAELAVAQAVGYHVAHPGGTVVAEEVVHVVAVFGLVVGFEEDEEVVELLVGEEEALLPDGTAFEGVFEYEVLEGAAGQVVVEAAAGEGPIEVGGVEVEGAVVVDEVELLRGVADADGAVAEGGVEFLAGTAGDDGGEGGVGEVGLDFLGLESG